VHTPVFVRFSLKNELPFDLVIDEERNAHGYKGFQARLTWPDSRTQSGPTLGVAEVWAHRIVSVPPSGSYSVLLPIARWFDFDVPGRYVLEIEASGRFTDGRLPLPLPPGQRIVIDIAPRDEAELRRVCSDLENQAMGLSDAARALEGVWSLSHIRDPVAVPYLARLLAAREKLAPDLVKGLRAIGDEPAADALISFAHDELEERRNLVRAALAEIAATTNDTMIRQKAMAALKPVP
jgi:hypothetical protein